MKVKEGDDDAIPPNPTPAAVKPEPDPTLGSDIKMEAKQEPSSSQSGPPKVPVGGVAG